MSGDGLKKALQATPFRPFRMHYGSGKVIPVRHPELLSLSPGGRTAFVWRPDESEESFDILDVLLVEYIDFEQPDSGQPGANGAGGEH